MCSVSKLLTEYMKMKNGYECSDVTGIYRTAVRT